MNIKFIIKEIKDKEVVLEDEKNNLVSWPKHLLPNDLKIGTIFYFNINKNRAKDILNEILNP
jgi:hypothetical protein